MGFSVAFYKRISIIMLQKSSARKGFCAEDWRFWRVKWYIQHAEASVLQILPRECIFFEKSFFARRLCRRLQLLSHDIVGLTIAEDEELIVADNLLAIGHWQLDVGYTCGST